MERVEFSCISEVISVCNAQRSYRKSMQSPMERTRVVEEGPETAINR